MRKKITGKKVKNTKKTIIFATSNNNKYLELSHMLLGLNNIEIKLKNIELIEIQGEPVEIVKAKLKAAYEKVKMPVIVEDTSLLIDAFGGLPGAYIKDFISKMGIKRIAEISRLENKTKAYAQCIIGYIDKDKSRLFKGRIKGSIVSPEGKSGFGWDPIFKPEGYDMTFAEMKESEKNKISHRKKALKKLARFLSENI